mgnify:CR=1 FL=1
MKNSTTVKLLALVLGLAVIVGCDKKDPLDDQENDFIPISLTTRQDACKTAANGFVFSFLEQVDKASANKSYFFSPLSVEFVLGMLATGTNGETSEQILKALGTDDLESLNSYAKTMLETLPSIDNKSSIGLANLSLYDKDVSLKNDYCKAISNYYGALVKSMDFNSKKTTQYVNKWASDNTKGTIKELIDDGDLNNQKFFLANALYFKGAWSAPYETTKKDKFHLIGGKDIQVQMMESAKPHEFRSYDKLSVLYSLYGNGAYCMSVYLPDQGLSLSEVMPDIVDIWENKFTPTESGMTKLVRMPMFKSSYEFDLNSILQSIGITGIFNNGSDFSPMTTFRPLVVSYIKQKSVIEVNDKGTEAAAVTYTGLNMASGEPLNTTREFIADRPFLYIISERSTNSILFMGKYTGE